MYSRWVNPDTGDLELSEDCCVRRSPTLNVQVEQKVACALRTFRGECFTNPEAGVPWFDGILGADVLYADAARAEIREVIADIPEIETVDSIGMEIDGRNLTVSYEATLVNSGKLSGEVSL